MIELTFCDSCAGSLKLAKSMKNGDKLQGAVAVIGGTTEDRHNAKKPRIWTCTDMQGSPKDVCSLPLYLDIGELSDHIGDRSEVLQMLYGRFDSVAGQMASNNRKALTRLLEAQDSCEPVRVWVGSSDPAELCGLYFVCDLLRDADVPLFVIFTPALSEKGNTITQYRSTGEILPEDFGDLAANEIPISTFRKQFYANIWHDLVRENAPLRAMVNGRVMSVPEDFYDFVLRANIQEGESIVAKILGKTLAQTPGVGDAWLYMRLQAMVRTGELKEIAPPKNDHPYSGVLSFEGKD